MNTNAAQPDLPLKYFSLAIVLSVPFWLLGGKQLPLPVNLPASAFGFFVPSLAAAILLYRQSGLAGVREFLQKAWDYRKVKHKIWYSIPYVQTRHSAGWVVWQCIKIIATRMVIVWIYNQSGKSVLAAMLFHATDNVSWSLFPNNGSAYNPFVSGLITWLTAGIVIVGRESFGQVPAYPSGLREPPELTVVIPPPAR